jgi:acyl-CoA synthetase (AMP-forming)/AMP-acid ligase II
MTAPAPPIWELAGTSPQAPALVDHRRRVSFGELEERTNAFGHGLETLGVQPGNHVALVATNRVEFVEALLGSTRAGMLVTPVKTSWTAAEIEYVLRDAGSRAVVTDVDAARTAAMAIGIPTIDLDRGMSGTSFEDWLAKQDSRPLPRERKGWRLSYTSGTPAGRRACIGLLTVGYLGARLSPPRVRPPQRRNSRPTVRT